MEENSGCHPIACESCRNKKSKCDRELPVCTQCSTSGTPCRYPPINKRGLPSGYISYIEQRLLDTELLVFELLSTVNQLSVPVDRLGTREREAITEFSLKQSKSAKVDEWKRLPLSSDEQRQTWWNHRKSLIRASEHRPAEANAKLDGIGISLSTAWEVPSPAPMSFEELPAFDSTKHPTHPTHPQPGHTANAFEGAWRRRVPDSLQLVQDRPLSAAVQAHGIALGELETSGSSPTTIIQPLQTHDTAIPRDDKWRKYF